jgi:hypothetical protein
MRSRIWTRFVFSREPRGKPVTVMPAGYEPAENINGQVTLRKIGSSLISEAEIRGGAGFKMTSRYSPIFRFRLIDRQERTFMAERKCYRSSLDARSLCRLAIWRQVFPGKLPPGTGGDLRTP